MNTKDRIIIFGTGKAAENFLLQSAKEYEIIAFADNDEKKQNKPFWGYKVIDPKQIKEFEFDRVIICSAFLLQINKQLTEDLGLEPEKVVASPKTAIYSNKAIEPFRDERTRKFAIDLIFFLSELFEKNNLLYFIDHGTLLGIVRDQDLIHWDDDIDISINSIDGLRVLKCLKKNLCDFPMSDLLKWNISLTYIESSSYNVDLVGKSGCSSLVDLLMDGIKPLGFTLYFTDRDESGINSFRTAITLNHFRDGMAYQSVNYAPEKHFLQSGTVGFLGRKLKVPYDPERYLDFNYGEDWRTPRKLTSYLELKSFHEPEAPGRSIVVAESP